MSQGQKTKDPATNVTQFNRFLNNNADFLTEKYNQYFSEVFPISQLLTPSCTDLCLKFIYDIFSFNKYEADPKLNNTLRKSLTVNIVAYVKQISNELNDDDPFTNQLAVKLLKYCIENNDMFAVHYDKKNPAPKKQTEQEQPLAQKQEKAVEDMQQSGVSSKPKVHDEDHKKQTFEQPVQDKAEENKQKIFEEIGGNEFEVGSEEIKSQNIDLIRKQLKGIFQFYCKQQQGVGPNFTFDNILHKSQTMNLGKFMAFANASSIVYAKEQPYSEARIQKNTLIATYKRLAVGQREIEFKTFINIMEELKKTDDKLYDRMGLGQDGLQGRNKLQEKLKHLNLPFNTRDPQGREIFQHGKIFMPKLTSHSGKQQDALREEIIIRRERGKYQPLESQLITSRNRGLKVSGQDETNKLTLRLGKGNEANDDDLQLLARLITHEDNDEIFLQEYKLSNKRNHNLQQRSVVKSFDEGGRYTNLETDHERHFSKNAASSTAHARRDDFTLPHIKRKGETDFTAEYRSVGKGQQKGRKC